MNGAGLRSMVQDGWRSGTVVALATGIDPSPLVLPSFSSLFHYTLLVSPSLSLYYARFSISLPFSLSPRFLSLCLSLVSVEHTDTDVYTDLDVHIGSASSKAQKRKISFLARSCSLYRVCFSSRTSLHPRCDQIFCLSFRGSSTPVSMIRHLIGGYVRR